MAKNEDILSSRRRLDTDDLVIHDDDVSVGKTRTHFNIDIQSGITYTINGSLVTTSPQVQLGASMVVNGSIKVL